MKSPLLVPIGIAFAVVSASAVTAEDLGARTVQYHAADIVPIHAKVKYTTLIEVPSTEKILEAATGDKEFWVVDVVGNFCFVHPAKAGIGSNLNLITDKGNIYSFTLQDVSDGSATPDLKVLVEPVDRSSMRGIHRPGTIRASRAVGAVAETRWPRCRRTSHRQSTNTRALTR